MAPTRFILLILALLGLVLASDSGDVTILSTSNFDEFINKDLVLVEFFAPWCGHCKKLAPEYEVAATTLLKNDPPVHLGSVDATIEDKLAQRFGVTGYPTLKVFRNGVATEYQGPRDAPGIIKYMQKQSTPTVALVKTQKDIDAILANEPLIIYFGNPSGSIHKAFETLSKQQRDNFRFAQTDAKELLDVYGHKDEVVILQSRRYTQSPLESVKAVSTQTNAEGLLQWTHDNILPLVGEYHNDNKNLYSLRNKPLIKFFAPVDWARNSKGANYIMNKIRKVAKEYSDTFSFAVTDKAANAAELKDLLLHEHELPYTIHHLEKNHRFPGKSTFSVDSFKAHIAEFLADKLEPFIKSEPVPEHEPGKATVVVGKTFQQIVAESDKDVLLEAYAPWCGHCKKLTPIYDELAAKMEPYADQITIAKVDATANEIPPQYNIKGYPTIFWIPAGTKKPVNYDGPREVDGFVKYIKQHTSKPLVSKVSGKDEL